MPNNKNKEVVKDLKSKVAKAKSIVFTDYKGLASNKMNDLRAQMREQDVEIVVAKNTLLKIALKEENYNIDSVKSILKDNTAALISYSDAIAPLKALFEFVKKNELPKVKAAYIEKDFNNAVQVELMSKLPSKDVLLAQVVGGMKSPLVGFVNVLSGSQKKLVYALSAIAKQKA